MRAAVRLERRGCLRTAAAAVLGWPALLIAGPASASRDVVSDRQARSRAWFTETRLIDQDGRAHAMYSDLLAPRTVLISALFVGCSSACPLIVQRLDHTRQALGERFGADIWFLSITVDPLHDDPPALKRFAQRFGVDRPGWRFLTGEPTDVSTVLQRLGLWSAQPDDHATTLIAGKARAARWAKLRPDLSPQALALHLTRLLEAS
ncbi:MAG: SCO family protein [Caldimonas manganoxidans]|nr:SCO family protein [Caldimonas manganoxidans]